MHKGFRATYDPFQSTSVSGKAFCISAGNCKTTYCHYYNSIASSEKSLGAELLCLLSKSFTYRGASLNENYIKQIPTPKP